MTRIEILTSKILAARWQASPRTIRRLVGDGLLRQARLGGRVGYFWPDVWACEGGQPPEGACEAYRARLLTPEQAAARCPLAASTLRSYAAGGRIPYRRIGAQTRFVPMEFDRWLLSWRVAERPKNESCGQNNDIGGNKPNGA